jgi:puromycin-sensitive aminopeptidase
MVHFRRWLKLLVFAIPLLAGLTSRAQAQRLPGNVVPENYKLFLDPNIQASTFSGEETIVVQLKQPLTEIVVNALDLEITFAEIVPGATTTSGNAPGPAGPNTASPGAQSAQVSYDKPSETVRLAFTTAVPPGPAKLHLEFSGKMTEGLRGLYLSKSQRRMYAVTQFEGTYARMMFPGFDEPGFKATFDLSVMVDQGDTAISNGRIIADEPASTAGRHKLTFSTSPRMSTYLVALAVGDWQCLDRAAGGVPIRVCAVPESKDLGRFALDVASHSIEFYNQWYGIKYPFGKLDMLAIPDYEWGGMENTASIFYRDTALLLNEAGASVLDKRAHAIVIAHEIAHQWFGDLVTPVWWDDIWLNEGFATWMERKPIAAWHPEWRLEEDEAVSAQQIISVDSLASARAIHGNPRTSSQIKEMFDGITYEKGGAVLRMLESYVGPETFRRGVNRYLQEHANGNATSADFWKAEAIVSGKPVDRIMPTFVLQAGVPVVSVRGECRTHYASLQFEQQRFYLSPESGDSRPAQQWQIPICLKVAKDRGSACELITNKKEDVALKACPAWFFANRDAKGYYRVAYDPLTLMKIADAAEKELNAPERIALLEDAWAMTHTGRNSVGVFMQLAQTMRSEHDGNVIGLVASHLGYVESSLVGPEQNKEQAEKYRRFMTMQFGLLAQQLGWALRPDDGDEEKALRARLLAILGRASDPQAIAVAKSIVQKYLKNPDSVEGTIVGPAFHVAAENGDVAFYDQLTEAVDKTGCDACLFALAAFRQPTLTERTVGLIDQGKVRQQDFPRFFSALLANPAAQQSAWNYLKEHWEALADKVTTFGGRGAVSALGNFCSAEQRQDVKQFYSAHPVPGAERALQQSLEQMNNCIKFKQTQQKNMDQWLAEQNF